jgi:hypothetical protein
MRECCSVADASMTWSQALSACRYAEYSGLTGSSYPGLPMPAGLARLAVAPKEEVDPDGTAAPLVDVQALSQSVRDSRERLQEETSRRAKAQVCSTACFPCSAFSCTPGSKKI